MNEERRQHRERRAIVSAIDQRVGPAVLWGLNPPSVRGVQAAAEQRELLAAGLSRASGGAFLILLILAGDLLFRPSGLSLPALAAAVGAMLLQAALLVLHRLAEKSGRSGASRRAALPLGFGIGPAWVIAPGLAEGSMGVAAAAAAAIALLALALAPLPAAVLSLGLGTALGTVLGGIDPAALLAPAVAGAAGAWCLAEQARTRIRTMRRAVDATGVMSKALGLLSDFEESGKGWFWETDSGGRLTYISPQLAHQLSREPAALIGTPLTDLFADESATDEQSPRGERTVGFHLSARFAFSDAVVRAAGIDPPRWWSLSGRPATSETGAFAGFRGNGTDLTEMRRSEAEVTRLARFDALTGLPNRSQMRQTLETAMREAQHGGQECALMLLDLDRFKSVNDTLGHPVGDALLRQVSERLLGVVGEQGRVGRLGGDEFKVVVPRVASHAALTTLADAIIARLSCPYMIEGATVSIGASVGIAVAPHDGDCPDALIRNADLALYAAKADGKGVHRFYQKEMHATARDRRLLEEDLRNALTNGSGLHLQFQPIVKADTGAITGFEALARWTHPTRGEVSPGLFIPLAEETGLISQVGEWVIREACREASRWPDPVRVAVNISPIQFASPALPGIVLNALAESQLAPQRLELEITEGVFLNDSAASETMFGRLAAIGVRFALDDFGTGYSSLGYLKRAPFNKIKIDQSFVRGAAIPGNRNAAIIRAIVTLADSLGMETTAEGAETHDELELIRSLGCGQVQGYIFGRPMTPAEALVHVTGDGRIEAAGHAAARAPRIAVLRSALLYTGGEEEAQAIRVRNISEGGAMAETSEDVPTGCVVELAFPGGERIKGEVRWSEAGRCGIQFAEAVSVVRLTAGKPVRGRAAA